MSRSWKTFWIVVLVVAVVVVLAIWLAPSSGCHYTPYQIEHGETYCPQPSGPVPVGG